MDQRGTPAPINGRIVHLSGRLILWPWCRPLINSRAEEIERIILFLSSPITAVCGRERERRRSAYSTRLCPKPGTPLLPDRTADGTAGRSDDCTAHAGTEQTARDGWRRARGPFLAPRRVATSPSPRRAVFRAATRSLVPHMSVDCAVQPGEGFERAGVEAFPGYPYQHAAHAAAARRLDGTLPTVAFASLFPGSLLRAEHC